MKRRSFLASAAGLAAAPVASLASPGSSVAPVGRVSTSAPRCPSGYYYDGDGCVRDYSKYCSWAQPYPHNWLSIVNCGRMAVGARPIQRAVYQISDPRTDPWFRAQLTPEGYADVNDLADWILVGGGAGMVVGMIANGPRGAVAGGAIGVGYSFLAWMAWNTGILIARSTTPPANVSIPVPVPSAPNQLLTYNGWQWNDMANLYGSGFYSGGGGGGYGWGFVPHNGGSDTIFHALY